MGELAPDAGFWIGVLIRILRVLAAWGLAAAALWLIRFGHGRLKIRIIEWRESLKGSRDAHKTLKLMTATKLRGIEELLYRAAMVLAAALLIPGALTVTLRQIPATESFAETWLDAIRDPIRSMFLGFVEYLPSLLFLIVWIAIVSGLLKLNRLFWKWVDAGAIVFPGFHTEWAYPTSKILAFLLVAFGLVVAFPYLPGGNSDAFKGVSIFIGVLISLGSGSAMANVFAGIVLTYTRAFHVGDRIRVGDYTGDVIERTLLVTRLRTIKNEDVVIPNATVVSTSVVNYSEIKDSGQLILHTTVTIGYDAPWRKVHELLIEAAKRTEGILPSPIPFVMQTALNDYNVSYQINAHTDQPARMAEIYSDLHRHIQDTFNEGGIEIMSPGYHAIRDGNQTTVPASYLPPDYRKPGFRVESS
jgi:small-conductance mechanosensitive channel